MSRIYLLFAVALCGVSLLGPLSVQAQQGSASNVRKPPRTVKGLMQARPGGPLEEVEVEVHEVPVDLPSVPAGEAPLADDDLVLGVAVGDQAIAYPIRYLAMYEVVDDRVGKLPVAPTW